MPKTYEKADATVTEMATMVLCKHESHKPLLDHRVRVDILMVVPPYNEQTGEYDSDAIMVGGYPAAACIKILGLKDRTVGRGDAEMLISYPWWRDATEKEQEALLDHELHHLAVKLNKVGQAIKDDLGRPKLWMRKHDVQAGWFAIVAQRNGEHSAEQQQAKKLMGLYQQVFWPQLEAR